MSALDDVMSAVDFVFAGAAKELVVLRSFAEAAKEIAALRSQASRFLAPEIPAVFLEQYGGYDLWYCCDNGVPKVEWCDERNLGFFWTRFNSHESDPRKSRAWEVARKKNLPVESFEIVASDEPQKIATGELEQIVQHLKRLKDDPLLSGKPFPIQPDIVINHHGRCYFVDHCHIEDDTKIDCLPYWCTISSVLSELAAFPKREIVEVENLQMKMQVQVQCLQPSELTPKYLRAMADRIEAANTNERNMDEPVTD